MSETKTCARCGAVVPVDALRGLCPKCVAALALAEEAAEAARPAGPQSRAAGATTGTVSLPPPKTKVLYFGDYELQAEIGCGGMGVVYKARQMSLNRLVAVKMLLSGGFASEEAIRRFKTEAEAAASLQHPNIVAIHEVGCHEGLHYLSMDYIEGPSLADLVKDQPLPPDRAARYVQIIAEAVHYAHERGILHRDLKPGNVLIDPFDQPRITDFGLAKRLTDTADMTTSGQVLGSVSYMPPEQAGGRRTQVGVHSDIFSLGAILYHLLTGRPPFSGATLEDTLRLVQQSEPLAPRKLKPDIPRDLETICLKCLRKAPQARYATAADLAEDLRRWRAGEPIRARPMGWPEKAWRWGWRHRAALALSAASLLLLLAGWWTLVHREPEPPPQSILTGISGVPLQPLPLARAGGSCVVVNGRLHLFGGESRPCSSDTRHLVYDPATDAWTEAGTLTTPRVDTRPVLLDGKVYLIGGHISCGSDVALVEVYDPATDTWSGRAPLPKPLSRHAAASVGGKIYVFGGERDQSAVNRTVFVYDPAQDAWTTAGEFPQLPHAPSAVPWKAAASLGTDIFVLVWHVPTAPDGCLYSFSTTSHVWTARGAIPGRGRAGIGVPHLLAFANKLVVISQGEFDGQNSVYLFSPSEGKWELSSHGSAPFRARPSFEVADDEAGFYVVGGLENRRYHDQFQYVFFRSTGPPRILRDPPSLTVPVGETARLQVLATGTEPLFYQWHRRGTNIAGATQAVLALPDFQAGATGFYEVSVSNRLGHAESQPAFVRLGPVRWAGNGHYYERVDVPRIAWPEAKAAAEQRFFRGVRGHLATITSPEENQFIVTNLLTAGGDWWLGGYQPPGSPEPDGNWRWVTDEPWAFTYWAASELNNYGGREDVLEIRTLPGEIGRWNDRWRNESGHISGYIVEYPTPADASRQTR